MEETIIATSFTKKQLQFLKKYSPIIKIMVLAIPLSVFDFGTDVFWTKTYVSSSVYIVQIIGVLLLVALLVHNCVATFYGLSILNRQPKVYSRLWKTKIRRCCVVSLHLLGLGSLVFHLDYLADLISQIPHSQKRRPGQRREERQRTDAILFYKERNLESMQLIQAFVEAFPQFILQTAALFITWTSGTETQCFPGTIVF